MEQSIKQNQDTSTRTKPSLTHKESAELQHNLKQITFYSPLIVLINEDNVSKVHLLTLTDNLYKLHIGVK
jgi:hypothetical protein